MKLGFALLMFGLALGSLPASAAVAPTCKDTPAAQSKAPVRKVPESRERKRPPSTSVGRGCVGCILPLDGIASTMAVRSNLS